MDNQVVQSPSTHHRTANEILEYPYIDSFNEASTLNNIMFQEGATNNFSQGPLLPDSDSDFSNFYAGHTYYTDGQIYYDEI